MIGSPVPRERRCGYTLVELLIAVGIIAVLGTLTALSVRGIAKDARLSSAENSVTASLAAARGLAMKEHTPIAVVFRVRWDPDNPGERQRTEIVTAKWTGESIHPEDIISFDWILERFLPVNGVPVRVLPPGIKVAGPSYDLEEDLTWRTQPELALTDPDLADPEAPGAVIGVMFGPDGTVITRNPRNNTGNYRAFVDFSNGDLDMSGDPLGGFNNEWQDLGDTTSTPKRWFYDEPEDENNINFVPFLAVYDDDEAREAKTRSWSDSYYETELTGRNGFIAKNGRLIHFNRYTGVVISGGGER